MERIYFYRKGIHFEYKIKSETFPNTYFNNELYHIKEYWAVTLRLNPKWFARDDVYYDGWTYKSITILGLEFGKSYWYDSRALKSWEEKDLKF